MPVKTRSHFGLKHRGSVKSRRPEVPASRSPMKAMMTEVSSSRGCTAWATSARSLVTAAVLVGQIAEGAATSVMMPLKMSMNWDDGNMMITMMVCSTIFAAGVLIGCLMQCVWRNYEGRRWCNYAVRLGRGHGQTGHVLDVSLWRCQVHRRPLCLLRQIRSHDECSG